MDFIKFKETNNLTPLELKNKAQYYLDLTNIEENWTGRLDAQIANTFILEAVQLIVNSICLFEQGYFDASFYSLRQSLEVSTVMTYLVDNDEATRKTELAKWKAQSRFPMYSQMLKMLNANKLVFADIKAKMESYFQTINTTKQKLNKYVHKQGFNTFYVSKNHPLNQNKSRDNFIAEYENYLKKCIGAIAVFRLAIDPFPVLLNDDELYTKTGDLMTRGYDNQFIDNYLGRENIELYKRTEMYQNHYDSIIQEESKNQFTLGVVKNQFIDKSHIDEILEQKHLLSEHDVNAVILCGFSEKIAKVYCIGGLQRYFSSTESKRKQWSWSSLDFKNFKEDSENYNLKYDEAFISVVELKNDDYYIEHNEQFNAGEIEQLEQIKAQNKPAN